MSFQIDCEYCSKPWTAGHLCVASELAEKLRKTENRLAELEDKLQGLEFAHSTVVKLSNLREKQMYELERQLAERGELFTQHRAQHERLVLDWREAISERRQALGRVAELERIHDLLLKSIAEAPAVYGSATIENTGVCSSISFSWRSNRPKLEDTHRARLVHIELLDNSIEPIKKDEE